LTKSQRPNGLEVEGLGAKHSVKQAKLSQLSEASRLEINAFLGYLDV